MHSAGGCNSKAPRKDNFDNPCEAPETPRESDSMFHRKKANSKDEAGKEEKNQAPTAGMSLASDKLVSMGSHSQFQTSEHNMTEATPPQPQRRQRDGASAAAFVCAGGAGSHL